MEVLFCRWGPHRNASSVQPAGSIAASTLPPSSIAIPMGAGAAAVMALGGRFYPAGPELKMDCNYLSSSEPQALACDRALLSSLAKEAERIGYTVVMSDSTDFVPQNGTSKDHDYPVKWR